MALQMSNTLFFLSENTYKHVLRYEETYTHNDKKFECKSTKNIMSEFVSNHFHGYHAAF